jgi:pimeloyl-ACP methyl ester carboxylesterase
MNTSGLIILIVVLVIGPVLVSYVVEALRPKPTVPAKLSWEPDISIDYVDVNGIKLRYVTVGEGKPLVLLHTLRTQLDIFQKIIPELSKHFQVYAFDYPGHGWSDITGETLKPEVFYGAASGFLDALDINDAVVAGISIGGTIPLVMAARHNPRIKKVVSINPYDYGSGGGIQRSSFIANLIFTLAKIPVLGDTVMRMRNRMVEDQIFKGGVYNPEDFPPSFLDELYTGGCRPGHYKSFLSLIRNSGLWDEARGEYKNINVPVLLIYGDDDWSNPEEREANQRDIPGVKYEIIKNAGHFLSLDAPNELSRLILEFVSS